MKKKKLKSIRLEMVLAISLLSILLCAVFYAAATSLSKASVTNVMVDSLNTVTKQGAELIAERVQSNFQELNAIATNDLLFSLRIDENRLYTYLDSVRKAQYYNELVFVTSDGTAYSSNRSSYPIGDNEHYRIGIAGNNHVTDPVPTGEADKMVMTYSVPVFNSGGGISGVLIMTTDGYDLANLIKDITFAETGYAYIVNSDGVMIAHPDRTMVYTQDRTLEKAQSDPAQKGLADVLSRVIAGESGVGDYTYKGVTKSAGYMPIQGTRWFMALTAPHSEVFAEVDQLQWILLAAAALLAILSAGVAFYIASRIARPILPMVRAAEKFAVGDLDVDVDVRQNNEIGLLGRALQTVSTDMSALIANIRSASEQVAVGSRQIASSGMNLAQGATEQASALEELSASVEQLASQTRMNAASATEANDLVVNTRSLAERGNAKMDDMLKAMEDIDQSSSDIHRIIKVIDDIAFQTNILALNAAVEAARAGQHGRGFAVVAEEVRNLAAKSASAAKETSGLIEGSSKSVAGGAKLAHETAESLREIVDEINRVAALVHNISVSSGEQTIGIDQINQGLLQISQVVQGNSATSQQSAAASKELTAQADTLLEQVAGFKLKGEGASQDQPGSEAANPEEHGPAVLSPADVKSGLKANRKAATEKAYGEPGKAADPATAKANPAPVKADKTPVKAGLAPAKAARRPLSRANETIPGSGNAANAGSSRPTNISLGEDAITAPERPSRISLGEEDDAAPARPGRITLSDSEFGKY